MAALALGAGTLPQAASAATFFFTGTPYRSAADIPSGFYATGTPSLLENFESGTLHSSLQASRGSVIGFANFGSQVDSVDGDDGLVNGTISTGRSWFADPGSTGVRFTFLGTVLPTAFGLVWTDGGGAVTFSAVAADGSSLGSITRSGFPDNSFFGTVFEDRFFGVTSPGGIRSIFVSNSSGGIEIDHVQYGDALLAVPVPAAGWLMLTGIAGLLAFRRRG
jgi:hypothetical protein